MITRRRRREVVRESETAAQALDRLIREEEDRGAPQEARTASLEDLIRWVSQGAVRSLCCQVCLS